MKSLGLKEKIFLLIENIISKSSTIESIRVSYLELKTRVDDLERLINLLSKEIVKNEEK